MRVLQCNVSRVFPVTGTGSDVQTPKCHLKKKTPPAPETGPKCKKVSVSDTSANGAILTQEKSKSVGAAENATSRESNPLKSDCHPSVSRTSGVVAVGEKTGAGSELEQLSVVSGDGKCSDFPTVDQTSGPSGETSTSEKQGPSYKGECCQVQPEPVCRSEQMEGHFYKHKSKRKHDVAKEETPEKCLQSKQRSKHAKHCRDAKFEGTRVPHLVKKRRYHQQNSEQASEAEERSSDDYVLEKLFKKSGNGFDESLT